MQQEGQGGGGGATGGPLKKLDGGASRFSTKRSGFVAVSVPERQQKLGIPMWAIQVCNNSSKIQVAFENWQEFLSSQHRTS